MSVNCEFVKSEYALYSVPIAALLWCGVAERNLETEFKKCVPSVTNGKAMAQATLRHPTIECLEYRMRAIFIAIDQNLLKTSREDGTYADDHVAYGRRCVYGKDLKAWAKTLPKAEQPKFLMSDQELQPEISHEIYARLKAEYDTLKIEHNRVKNDTENHSYAVRAYEQALKDANERIAQLEAVNQQSEKQENGKGYNTSLAIIHALHKMAGEPPIKAISAMTTKVGRTVEDDAISNRLNNHQFKQ